MKKIKRQILYPLILLLFFTTCKYEDGPAISFRSKTSRLCNDWNVDNLKIDGIDSTQRYKDNCGCCITFDYIKPHGDLPQRRIFLYGCKNLPIGWNIPYGNWSLLGNEMDISISGGGYKGMGPICDGNSTWNILRLAHDEFWFKTNFNGKEYDFKLK